MKIYNTLTRTKEELVTIHPDEARIYACGPTVYNFIHIGNARPLCVFDVLRRYLEYRGMRVQFVQNFTDIDDKLIRKANEEGTTVPQVAERYIAEFWTDAQGLGVKKATVHPRATENMEEILSLIGALVEKGYAYPSGGDVYFRTRRFDEYGKLSHQPIEDLDSGARIDVSEIKEDPLDFALWKGAKPGEPAWESPWGAGRPGWHIECSAMARRYLGNTIDIHCGGEDLVFPHHENEIAQSECANGCEFSHYWMHNGFINVDKHKMSKSLGNFFTVREVAEKFGYEPIRYLMIASHYRSPINYSVEVIEQCRAALDRLYQCRETLSIVAGTASADEAAPALRAALDGYRARFCEAMDDDLNTADAIGVLFEMVRELNIWMAVGASVPPPCPQLQPHAKFNARMTGGASASDAALGLAALNELCGVLGLLYERVQAASLDEEIEALIAQRTQARKDKNWKRADEIRDELSAKGIVLKDTPQGVVWSRKDG